MRLLAVELRRFVSRRLVQVLFALSVAAILVSAVITAVTSDPPDQFRLEALGSIYEGVSLIVAILGWVLGASMIGAEWHAGAISTFLTWEPRRVRASVTRASAAVLGVVLLAIALQAMLGGALAVVAAVRGTTEGTDGEIVRSAAETALRSALLAGFAAAVAFAIASVARNTAAALAIVFVWVAVIEGLVRGLRPGWAPWLIGDNGIVFLTGSGGIDRTMAGAGLLLSAYAVGLVAIACGVFARRDVS